MSSLASTHISSGIHTLTLALTVTLTVRLASTLRLRHVVLASLGMEHFLIQTIGESVFSHVLQNVQIAIRSLIPQFALLVTQENG